MNDKIRDLEIDTPAGAVLPQPESDAAATIVRDLPLKGRTRQRSYYLDLRIHSPASLGYLAIEGIDTAPALVRLAKVKGLDAIAITDFYTGQFIDRVTAAAAQGEVMVIPGLACRCAVDGCDDVTITAIFPLHFRGADIEAILKQMGVTRDLYGNRKHVLKMPFADVLALIEGAGGAVIPSRMDKTPHRMMVLPAMVDRFGFRAFDMAYADTSRFFRSRWPKTKFNLFSFSNAHALAQVGSRAAKVKMNEFTFSAVRNLFVREMA